MFSAFIVPELGIWDQLGMECRSLGDRKIPPILQKGH